MRPSEQYKPKTNEERHALLWRLFDELLDALIEHLEQHRAGKLKLRAQFALVILAFLKMNNIRAEKISRRGALGELRNLRAALEEQKEPEKELEEFAQGFAYGSNKTTKQ
jgi:hypothetical protein